MVERVLSARGDWRCATSRRQFRTLIDVKAGFERHQALFGVNEGWLAGHSGEILEQDFPIVDPHHHLWDRGGPYMLKKFLADTGSGH